MEKLEFFNFTLAAPLLISRWSTYILPLHGELCLPAR
jgi:hypothetical protein